MAGITTERRENFRSVAENFKRCIRTMGYRDVKVTYPLDVLENKELTTKFVIDYGEYVPSSMNIRMKAKGVWTYIYMPFPEERMPAGGERIYEESEEIVPCEQCGCMDFVKKGEEYACAICCQSKG